MADLAVLDLVVLAFQAQAAAIARGGHGALHRHEVVVAHHLGADEAARDVGVDGARRVLRARAARDGPRPHLVLAHREERDQAQQRVAVLQHPADGGLGEPQVGQERGLLRALELRDLRLDHRRHPADAGAGACGHLTEAEALDQVGGAADLLLGEVQAMEDRLLRQEREPADGAALVLREAQGADRAPRLQRGLDLLQHRLLVHVGIGALLLDLRLQPLEAALHHLEVRQHQLGLEVVDVARGVGRGAARVGERAHHVEQRVRVPELLGLEPLALALRDAGQVHHLEGGQRDLLRLEDRGQAVDPRVRHPRHARVHLTPGGAERRGGDAGAGQQVEERRLAALGESDQPDLHEGPCYHTALGGRGATPCYDGAAMLALRRRARPS